MKSVRTDHEPQTVTKCSNLAPKLAKSLRNLDEATRGYMRSPSPVNNLELSTALRNAALVLSEWDLLDR